MIEIKNLTKMYKGTKKAVNQVNLQIEEGDIFGFIGHNGAGKSTTIKSLVGIIQFNQGEVLFDGISMEKDAIACKKKLAYIPDNPDLYEHLTGIQYLNFICDIFQVEDAVRTERIEEYGRRLEILPAFGDLISSYSHGMKQKLAIVSALVHEPKYLILDEPFVGLDPMAVLELKHIMKELCEKGGAVFFSTHVLDVAEKLCNKVAIIKGGELVISGNMEELVEKHSLEALFMEVQGE